MGWNEQQSAPLRDEVVHLSAAERIYLKPGLTQPGGKLPLFDETGARVSSQTMRSCIRKGVCEPWFANPMKPDWLVCRLTEKGRIVLTETIRAR